MSDDDARKRPDRARSMMGDTQRSMIGEHHRKSPPAGAPIVEVFDENSEVYGGADVENVRKRAEVRGKRETRERVAKVEVKNDALKERVAQLESTVAGTRDDITRLEGSVTDVTKDVGEMKGDVKQILSANASITSAFDMYIKMHPPAPPPSPKMETITEIVRQTATSTTQETLAAHVLQREDRRAKFWDSVWLKVIGAALGAGGLGYWLHYMIEAKK